MAGQYGTNVGSIYYEVDLDTGKLINGRAVVERETEKAARAFNVITTAIKVYAAALSALKLAEAADDFRLLQARVNVASDSVEAGAAAFEKLRAISVSTRSALDSNVQVFTRLNPSIKQMGGNAQDTLRIVELLSKAITVSGATAAEKSSAMIQFGQALGSGKLAGDELRSLLENAPYLMKQLAAGLGVPIGQLKSLGEQGKLTADVVVNALTKAGERINKDFAQFPETVASAVQVATDQFKRLATAMDDASNKNAALAGIVKGLGNVFDYLADRIIASNKESDKLSKADKLKTWAAETTKVLSYVVDAADFVSRGFQQIGIGLGGMAAAASAAARGELAGARDVLGQMLADMKDIGRPQYAGARLRQQTEALASGAGIRDRFDVAAGRDSAPSKLKAPVDPEEQRKLAAKRAAAQAYLDGLLADAKTGLAKIDAEERKAFDENKKRQLEDPKNADIYGKAKAAITAKYARERALLEETYTKEAAALNIAITEDENARIEAIRAEAFRAADAEVQLGVKTFEQGERAKLLAAYDAGQKLLDLADRNAKAAADRALAETRDTETRIRLTREETIRALELAAARGKITQQELEAGRARADRQAADDTKTLNSGRADTRIDTLQLRAGAGGIDDQVALIKAEAQKRLNASLEAQQADLANAQLYADQRVAIEEDMQRRLTAARSQSQISMLSSTASAFEALANATKSGTDKQDAVYRASFYAQKAFAIASSIVAIQTGVAQASSLPFPANLGAMASVIASTASIIATIKGANYGGGREYGGPVSAGTMYRVNEAGRPEMFTAANGAQYMLPTADGRVTSADKVAGENGSGAARAGQRPLQVVQNFHLSGPADLRTQQQMAAAAARGLQIAGARNN